MIVGSVTVILWMGVSDCDSGASVIVWVSDCDSVGE